MRGRSPPAATAWTRRRSDEAAWAHACAFAAARVRAAFEGRAPRVARLQQRAAYAGMTGGALPRRKNGLAVRPTFFTFHGKRHMAVGRNRRRPKIQGWGKFPVGKYENVRIGFGPLLVGYASFLGWSFFEGCLNRRYNVTRRRAKLSGSCFPK